MKKSKLIIKNFPEESKTTMSDFFGIQDMTGVKDKPKDKPEDNPEVKDKNKDKEPAKKVAKKEDEEVNYEERYNSLKQFEEEPYQQLVENINETYEGETFADKYKAHQDWVAARKEEADKLSRLKELEERDEAREKELRALNITRTKDWQDDYEKPLQEAKNLFTTTIVEVDDEGKILHPDMFGPLVDAIWNKGEETTPGQIKAILKKFASDYEDQTGEVYDAPAVSDILKARRDVASKLTKRNEAFNNWEEQRKKDGEDKLLAEEDRRKKLLASAASERKDQYNDSVEGFDYSSLSAFFEEDDIKGMYKETYEESEKAFSGESQGMSYTEMIDTIVKAKMFDKMLDQAKADRNFVVEYKDGEDDNLDQRGGENRSNVKPDKDGKIDFFGTDEMAK